jgi:choline dehydrogenase-like flavoprotein
MIADFRRGNWPKVALTAAAQRRDRLPNANAQMPDDSAMGRALPAGVRRDDRPALAGRAGAGGRRAGGHPSARRHYRMGASPHAGVADTDCHVFGIDNLYAAGSSVSRTSGYANPMLTIVALAIPLSDTLKQRVPEAA